MTSPTTRRGAATPQEMHSLFKQLLERGDLDGLLGLYEEDAAMMSASGEGVTGPAAIRENLAPFVATEAKITFDPPQVLQSGNLALVHARWSATGTGPEGPYETAGFTSEVLRRQANGTWLYILDDPGMGVAAP